MLRVFLTLWLAAFAVQTTDLLATVIPDSCVEDTRGSAADPCPENCARCVCCARLPVFVPHVLAPTAADVLGVDDPLPPIERTTNPAPRGILHVPKVL